MVGLGGKIIGRNSEMHNRLCVVLSQRTTEVAESVIRNFQESIGDASPLMTQRKHPGVSQGMTLISMPTQNHRLTQVRACGSVVSGTTTSKTERRDTESLRLRSLAKNQFKAFAIKLKLKLIDSLLFNAFSHNLDLILS